MSRPLVRLDGISKRYGRALAVDGLDLEIGPGELVGLLGANGAGKTTVVKLLLGLTRPTSGRGEVLGRPLGDREARARIGYLPELFRFQPWLTAREILELHADLARLPRTGRRTRFDDALGLVGLSDRGSTRVATFSKGMQQRLGLALAVLGDPVLVLLDEPTSALDPLGRIDVRGLLRVLRDRGATVVLDSHLLTEVEQVCDRIVILRAGRVVATGPLDAILGDARVRVRVDGLRAGGETDRRLAAFGPLPGEAGWRTFAAADDRVPDLVAALVALGGRVHAVEPGRATLERRFLELAGPGGDR